MPEPQRSLNNVRVPHGLSLPDAAEPFSRCDFIDDAGYFGEDAVIPKKDLDAIRDFLTSQAADFPAATPRERHYMGRNTARQHASEDYQPRPGGTRCTRTSTSTESNVAKSVPAANCLACHYGKVIR